jgi:excisionase family DNA binding protein
VAFLTAAEVAFVVRVCEVRVYRLVHSGLPAIRVGRWFCVPEQALHQYLYGRRRGHPYPGPDGGADQEGV